VSAAEQKGTEQEEKECQLWRENGKARRHIRGQRHRRSGTIKVYSTEIVTKIIERRESVRSAIDICQTLRMTFTYRRSKASLFATLALGLFALTARAEDTAAQATARKAITAQYAFTDQAAVKMDLDAFFSTLTPDFESKRKDGSVMQRPEFEMQQRQLWSTPGLRVISAATKIDKLEWFGEEAIVWSSNLLEMVVAGKTVRGIGSSRELWRPVNNKWLVKRTVELKSETIVDGKAVPVS
jgi:hypothetical protein